MLRLGCANVTPECSEKASLSLWSSSLSHSMAQAARLGRIRTIGRLLRSTSTSPVAITTRAASTYVPVIDLGGLTQGGNEAKKRAQEIRRACQEVGFFIITNHGVAPAIVDRAWRSCRAYFDLPLHIKGAVDVAMTEAYPYGYCGVGGEILSKGKDYEMGKVSVAAPDLKESFSVGPYNPASGMRPTRWPVDPPDFKHALLDYYKEMEKLAAVLLGSFEVALELPTGFFHDKVDRHCSALRVLNYPDLSQDPHDGQLRASSHTDYGIMTLLRQDEAPGGLQVMKRSGEWVEVPHLPNAYVVNLGDLMQRWTNDMWVSTPHRVVCPPRDKYGKSRRQSMAYFFNINADAMVECIDTCVTTKPAKYAPVNAMDFLMSKHNASTAAKNVKS